MNRHLVALTAVKQIYVERGYTHAEVVVSLYGNGQVVALAYNTGIIQGDPRIRSFGDIDAAIEWLRTDLPVTITRPSDFDPWFDMAQLRERVA